MKCLGINVNKIESISRGPFIQVSYSDAIEILKQERFSVKWGDDIKSSHEKILSNYFNEFPNSFPSNCSDRLINLEKQNP